MTTNAVEENDLERQMLVAGLRELADWIESHTEIDAATVSPNSVYIFCPNKAALATAVRALGRGEKYGDDTWYGVKRRFGPIVVDACGTRENVCRRVVKGTHEITKEIPDPDAPKVTITETVEDIEWVCEPLLAEAKPI